MRNPEIRNHWLPTISHPLRPLQLQSNMSDSTVNSERRITILKELDKPCEHYPAISRHLPSVSAMIVRRAWRARCNLDFTVPSVVSSTAAISW